VIAIENFLLQQPHPEKFQPLLYCTAIRKSVADCWLTFMISSIPVNFDAYGMAITVSSSPDTSSYEKSAARSRRIFSSQVLFLLSLSGRSAVCNFLGFLCFLLLNTTNARCLSSSSSGESTPWHLDPFSVIIILSSRRSVNILVFDKSFCKFILWNKRSQGTDDSTSTR